MVMVKAFKEVSAVTKASWPSLTLTLSDSALMIDGDEMGDRRTRALWEQQSVCFVTNHNFRVARYSIIDSYARETYLSAS